MSNADKPCFLSVIVPTYNESENISLHSERTRDVLQGLIGDGIIRDYEYIVIDNCSSDGTREIIKALCESDPRVQSIFNRFNYGPVISPFIALTQSKGDYAVVIAADLQEPPEMIRKFVDEISKDHDCDAIIAVKRNQKKLFSLMPVFRRLYYRILRFGAQRVVSGFSGFGLYSRRCIEAMDILAGADPSLRMLLPKTGLKVKAIYYQHENRHHGTSSYSMISYTTEALRTLSRHTNIAKKISTLMIFLSLFSVGFLVPLMIVKRLVIGVIVFPGFTLAVILFLLWITPIFIALSVILDKLEQADAQRVVDLYKKL